MVVMSEAASALSNESISDKEALKTVTNLVRGASAKNLISSQNELSRQPEVLEGCAKLLTRTNSKLQTKACQAIGTYAFGSETVATQIVQSPGMLDNLASVMEQDDKAAQLEAARTVCNCTAYSVEAADAFAAHTGCVNALTNLCGSKDAAVKAKAIAAISSLSAYPNGAEVLKNTSIVDTTLIPIVNSKKSLFGNNDLFQVTRLDAMTAIVNLRGGNIDLNKATAKEALKTFKTCLESSLKGKSWAGASWTPSITLLPLSKLACNEAIRPLFGELKFVKLFVTAFAQCASLAEQSLAMQCLGNISSDKACLTSMRKKKYNLNALLQPKTSCEHSGILAVYLVDLLAKVDASEEANSNDAAPTDDATSEKKDGDSDSDVDKDEDAPAASGDADEPAAAGN
eukprot:CAMPEP_0173380356 /NCGR_PEP_ID=MMETSP1356-20130122/3055_1 /TAXON_ID=77927 ORGANISM="Hemiselmis virescens, Strain PCC157" /NCGR_SAMPLE_ID=MMETSP1356 /ASSEMBLY_ACC=CAM_ASM_000847 /LENGTH=399 /DNA_ID=CAMNT_0014333917 /DNA_START=75 /DNA_END=1274 /DNA_ORIENTATION=-